MESLIHFSNFCKEITASNSRCYKSDVLESIKDDDIIKYYLGFLLNPYITTGIAKKKLARFHHDSCIDMYPENIFRDTISALEYLKAHNSGTNEVIDRMFSYYMSIRLYEIKNNIKDEEYSKLFERLITKDLQLGVDVKTVNKAIPDLIPEFNVQLAKKYFDNPSIVEGKTFALTTKIDGGRIVAKKKNGDVHFFTRQGQEYEGLVDLEEEMEKNLPDNTCLDGEITLLDPYVRSSDPITGKSCIRKLSSKEQYKETMAITRKKGEKHGVKMIVFDIMSADEFDNQKCDTPYEDRKAKLDYLFKGIKPTPFKYFTEISTWYVGDDASIIPEILNEAIKEGEEGIMINFLDAPYEFKRTNNLLKVKKMQDLDLEIIGFEEGSGQNSGKLGALLVNYKGFTVKVGSGISQEMREEIWNHQDEYIGLTAVVQYFEETHNQEGGISLRFPVLIDIRTDK